MKHRALLLSLLGHLLLLVWPGAARGDEIVRQVQEELRKRSIYFGDIDGRNTPQLASALRRYQERKGFASTGEADDITLRALSLLPPSPSVAANDRGSVANATSFLPWPDITVLRSDFSRSTPFAPTESEAMSTPSAPPAPPPAAAAARRISPDEVRRFVERYLQAGQTNNPAAETSFYGDQVDYFDDGLVNRDFIEKDVQRYDRRWPERKFTLLDPIKVSAADDASHTKVEFQYHFAVKGNEYMVQGKVGTTYVLAGDHPDKLKIINVKEQRLRR